MSDIEAMRDYGGRSYLQPDRYKKPNNLTKEQDAAWDEGFEIERKYWEDQP